MSSPCKVSSTQVTLIPASRDSKGMDSFPEADGYIPVLGPLCFHHPCYLVSGDIVHNWCGRFPIHPQTFHRAARISIGMSVTRLVQPKTRMHSILLAMNLSFVAMCCIVMTCRVVDCTRNTAWERSVALKCRMGYVVGSISLTSTYQSISLGLMI